MSNYARANSAPPPPTPARNATARALRRAAFTFLAIEFLDELVDGSRQAAWPLIRLDLSLSYTEIGLLLAVPKLLGNVVEPPLALLGDTRHRRAIILAGGVGFVLSLALVALSYSFASLLLAFALFNPASGAFVSLSQAALMDAAPARREQNMARWAFAGSLGVVAGSLALNATVSTAGASWRVWFGVMSAVSVLLVVAARRFIFDAPAADATDTRHDHVSLKQGALEALRALRRPDVRRWLLLLEVSDLMLDGFHGFLALYFVDVVGMNEAGAAAAIAVWTGVGLGGDFLLIPLLERVRGLRYLRWSAGVMLCLFPAFLLAPNGALKLVLLGLIGITNAGWYSILKAQLYSAMPERSGAALALNNLAGMVGVFVPFALGLFAEHFGLGRMMWLLLVAPVALLSAIPRREKSFQTC
ncbi:MAG TPA: MFS transporter [Pyrinomonadaceae bacterium]|jgi:FSR family fosmidomycin resistance protein-like MFS transporter|nr:MFS transporter [Pyrinomonadaceae bacterium]